jgi:hypothetical protein
LLSVGGPRDDVDTLWVMEGEQLVGVVGLHDLFTAPVKESLRSDE